MNLSNIDVSALMTQATEWVVTSGVQILIILIGVLITVKIAHTISSKSLSWIGDKKDDIEYQKRVATLKGIINKTLSALIFTLGIVLILGELGINLGPIIAAAGIIGLAVGFGAQELVKDIISGFFILLEDQIRVNDVVQVKGIGGLVERVDLRMIVLRDAAGNVHYIRNGQIDVITNMTKEYSRFVFDIGVAYRENVDDVIKIMKEVDEDLRKDEPFKSDILEPLEVLGLDSFGDNSVNIKARYKTKPIKQWNAAREYNRRLKMAFDKHEIEIPFPHRTIYFGVDKKGNAPAMRLQETGPSQN